MTIRHATTTTCDCLQVQLKCLWSIEWNSCANDCIILWVNSFDEPFGAWRWENTFVSRLLETDCWPVTARERTETIVGHPAIDRIPFSDFTCELRQISHRSSFSVLLIINARPGPPSATVVESWCERDGAYRLPFHTICTGTEPTQTHKVRYYIIDPVRSREQPSASFIFMNKNKFKATVKLFINSSLVLS